jgi:Icc protein
VADLVVKDRPLTVQDYEPSYRLLRDIVSPLRFPVHMLLGKHDTRPVFHRVMETGAVPDATLDYSFDSEGYHFVALDFLEPGKAGGRLAEEPLGWLSNDLTSNQETPTLVFVHHHRVPFGNAWTDGMVPYSGDDLLSVLSRHPQVQRLFLWARPHGATRRTR